MRSFNKARLIDLADKNLNPLKSHSLGKDGRLKEVVKKQKTDDQQVELKETVTKVEQDEVVNVAESLLVKEEVEQVKEVENLAVSEPVETEEAASAAKKLPKKKVSQKSKILPE